MSYHENKRRKHHQRPTQDSRPNFDFKVDEELYKSNYEGAERLRRSILSEFSLDHHELPKCSYKKIAKLEEIHKRWKPKAPSTHRCFYCSFKYNFASNIISKSDSISLILDSFKNCILEDQVLLVSNSHLENTLYLEDKAYTELRNYQKTLVYMFQKVNKAPIFVEMSIKQGQTRDSGTSKEGNHCKIECYPVPLNYLEEAKLYFLKALDEMGSNWSQHKRMTVTGKNGVRGTIPQGFDFIHVDFSLSGEGFARVIDDPSRFRYTFSRNIVAGVLNMDQLERAFRDNDEYNKAINNIRKNYKELDWTLPSDPTD